jgi:hypothetical protein
LREGANQAVHRSNRSRDANLRWHRRRGSSSTQPSPRSAAAQQLGDAPIASRYADYRQKPRLGSRGEDFPLVNRLQELPAAAQ